MTNSGQGRSAETTRGMTETVRRNPVWAEHTPAYRPFTASVYPDSIDARGPIQCFHRRGIIEKIGEVDFTRAGTSNASDTMYIWQATNEGSAALEAFEPVTDGVLPCGHDALKNIGAIDGAETDEPYIECKRCNRMYPRSQL